MVFFFFFTSHGVIFRLLGYRSHNIYLFSWLWRFEQYLETHESLPCLIKSILKSKAVHFYTPKFLTERSGYRKKSNFKIKNKEAKQPQKKNVSSITSLRKSSANFPSPVLECWKMRFLSKENCKQYLHYPTLIVYNKQDLVHPLRIII